MGAAAAGWVQAMATVWTGAALGYLAGGQSGAVVAGTLSGGFAIPYGRAVARARPYQGSPAGVRRCIVDATWSALNTWAGAVYYGLHLLAGNRLDVDRSAGAGSLWLVDGIVSRYATTIGPVKAGSNERIDSHEEIHVLQARLFGPLYLPLVALNYVVATVVPYWLFFSDRGSYTIDSVAAYFERGVYPHVWNELWAYRTAPRPGDEPVSGREPEPGLCERHWYQAAARGGWVARGLLFVVTAVLALQLGLGQRREETNHQGAMEELAQKPLGKALVLGLAVGLLAYAGWRTVEVVVNRSQEAGWTARVKHAAHAAAYLALSLMAFGTLGSPSGHAGGGQQQGITARVLSWPAGTLVVAGVGLAVFATGLGIAWQVVRRGHREELELDDMSEKRRRAIDVVAVAGNLGRALVFCLVGGFVVSAAVRNDPEQANGLDAALKELTGKPYGTWVLMVVALGLGTYGAFCLLSARRHRV